MASSVSHGQLERAERVFHVDSAHFVTQLADQSSQQEELILRLARLCDAAESETDEASWWGT